MKLRNKKTGEIIDIYKGEILLHYNQGRKTIHFKRPEDLAEWEDYEEPKVYWYINTEMYEVDYYEKGKYYEIEKFNKQIGNYFATKEEAEKAVEKLKAWKRLKDGGITFKNWTINQTGTIDCFATWGDNIPPSRKNPTLLEDLDLLFGGEE
jgi:hypothetical protein